ncbi:glutamate decarboxylase [Apodospora peruviana]|uniref:Glutamate decarboxylase n=1 Tax=Apodospora peruviana TaxID=516989 RepID=A0AAE0HTL8_9PEZI|nr:glutamate decarboxylase [Apodospora peruviana]
MGSIAETSTPSSQPDAPLRRADETAELLDAVKSLVLPFIDAADKAASDRAQGRPGKQQYSQPDSSTVLVEPLPPSKLASILALNLPTQQGLGKEGLIGLVDRVLRYSVNTWDQGFLDKLYSSTNAVGVISDLVLSVLNNSLHVYHVSPALTVIEKQTATALAHLFGFTGPRAGGFTTQGGSLSNLTSIVIARNTLYPETRTAGSNSHEFVLFTSVDGHYSIEKAAMACGMGSGSVWTVPSDTRSGAMQTRSLEQLVMRAIQQGKTPLYVNATAGTTVLGAFDPLEEIAAVCKRYGMWMHVDASWGGPLIFSRRFGRSRFKGAELADSLTINPHKMMNVPVPCSFLLGPDTAVFHRANTLPAGYLFHDATGTGSANAKCCGQQEDGGDEELWDLADMTLQCGRRGDALKLALSWVYQGSDEFERQVDGAFELAAYMADRLDQHDSFVLVSTNPPPCLQVCFYWAPGGKLGTPKENTRRTKEMVKILVPLGYMVDYAPGPRGGFFRGVLNWQTVRGTVDGLIRALEDVGASLSL